MLSSAAIADLRLLLRGLRLPVEVLGGTVSPAEAQNDDSSLQVDVVRLRLPALLAQSLAQKGNGVISDEYGTSIATIDNVSVADDEGPSVVVRGRIQTAGIAQRPLASADEDEGPIAVVIVDRPPLSADVDQLRALGERSSLVLAVPVATPSPDGLPAATLLRLTEAALSEIGTGTRVRVVPVELFRRDPRTDAALARQLARALGASDVAPMTRGRADWPRLLSALDGDGPLPPIASEAVLRGLHRWRPPRSRRGVVVLLTGLSGAGKSTLAAALAAHIRESTERTVTLLDGDLVRRLLSSGLGFDHASRDLNVRRNGFVAAEIARHGGIAVCALIAPYAESRAAIRAMAEEVGDFVLVHVSTPLAEAERRDVKGLYARARAGLIEHFTGISDPYEEPADADVTVDTSDLPLADGLGQIVRFLEERGSLPPAPRRV